MLHLADKFRAEPLAGTARTLLASDLHAAAVQALNSGSYGFVYLCKDLRTGELVAIKFIERGEKVTKASCTPCCPRNLQ